MTEDFPPRADITLFPLPEEPASDKGFEAASGNRYRARVTAGGESSEGDLPNRAPTHLTLNLTVAMLDEAGQVLRVGGAYVISERHEITIGPDQRARPGYDVGAAILDVVRIAIARLEAQRASQDDLSAQLSAWNVSFAALETPDQTPASDDPDQVA